MQTMAARSARSLRSQRGQSTLEWGGALLVVALIIGAVIASGLAGEVSHKIACTVDRVFQVGGGCQASPHASNVMVCPTLASTNTASDEVQVLFVKADHNNSLIKTTYSNGRVDYTLVDDGTLEAQAKLFQAEAQIAGQGFDVEATAAAGGELTGSYTFSFPNAAAANAFADKVQSGGGWGVVAHDFADGIPGAGSVLNWLGIHGAPSGSDLAQQYSRNVTYSYVAAGAVGQVQAIAQGNLGPDSAELGAELSAAGGARKVLAGDPSDPTGPQKGDVQIYVKLSGDADASLAEELFGPQVGAKASGDATAVITLDSSGRPKQLEIDGSGTAGASAGLNASKPEAGSSGAGSSGPSSEGSGGSGKGGGLLKSLDFSSTSGAGGGVQYTGTLDLSNDPTAVQDLTALLNPSSAGPAMTQLVNEINTNGTQRVQPYVQTTSHSGGGLDGEVFDIGGGVNANVDGQNQHLFAGWVKNPGQGWLPVICQR